MINPLYQMIFFQIYLFFNSKSFVLLRSSFAVLNMQIGSIFNERFTCVFFSQRGSVENGRTVVIVHYVH